MVTEDVVEDKFGVQEVCTKDGIDGRQGTAEVFGHQVGRDAAGEGRAAVGEGRRSILQGFEMTDICYKGRIRVGDKTFFRLIESILQFLQANLMLGRDFNNRAFITSMQNKVVNCRNIFVNNLGTQFINLIKQDKDFLTA